MAVKTDIRAGHDIAYVTRGHASGCAGAMAYYTRTGDPPGTWEGRGCAALGVSGTVQAGVAERLYQEGVGPGGERIIRHAAPKSGEDQAAAEAAAIARYREKHPLASASEINAERTRIRAISPGIARPYYDITSSASKSVSVLHASLRVAAAQARETGDQVKAAALDGEAQAIEDALREAMREGLELLEAMGCYVRTGHHSATTGGWRDGNGLVATSWLHTISRDGDPQLHIHLAVLNAVQRADGADDTWRAADGQHFYQLRHLYGVTVDRAFEQRLLAMGYAMTERADGNGAEIGGVSPQVMDRFSSRARSIDSRLGRWADQYTARHGKPPSRRTIYLIGQEIAKDTRRPKAEAKRMAGGRDTGHLVSDEERLTTWEDQTTADELQVLSAVYAEAKAYAARSPARRGLAYADKARAARIAVAEAQRQRSVWGIADLCLEAHRALPVGATPADITEVAMLAISGTAGAEVVHVSPAPDLMDVSSLGVRQSDGQSILRKPNTMRWAALDHLNLEETVINQARRPIRPLVTSQQVRDELDRNHQDLDGEQHQAVITLLTADQAMALLTAPAGAGKTSLVRARENAPTIDAAGQPLANRDVLRIDGHAHGQVQVRRQIEGGWSDPFLIPERYLADHGELAYAGNTHVAQGRTTSTAHLLVTGSLNRHSLYVGLTRGRQANSAYVATSEPELVNPEVILSEIIDNDGTELTATEAIRQAQEWSASTGHLASIWAAAMRGTVTQTIDSTLRERLPASEYQRYLREPQRQALQQALTERNLNGEDLTTLIERITAVDLAGARSISAVLHGRMAWTKKTQSTPSTWAQRTPENAPQLAHQAANAIDDRIAALGLRCADKPESWLTCQLGAFPAHGSALQQQDYLHRAGSAAAYREAAGIVDPHQAVSLTPHKGDPVRERMRRDTITHLEIRDEEELYRVMSRGELEAKELRARRAYAVHPKDVAAELKHTAQAEADQRQAAVEAELHGDVATAQALHSLADLLGTQKATLEADHAKHENWSAETAGLREEGGNARAELARRGQEPDAKPGETTLEWWQRFERDCQAFEEHLINLEAQAETEGRPWPPRPTAEHEAASEAEQSNDPDLDTAWSAEIRDEPSYEPEPDMPEAIAEI